jgi:hypothetical protein
MLDIDHRLHGYLLCLVADVLTGDQGALFAGPEKFLSSAGADRVRRARRM